MSQPTYDIARFAMNRYLEKILPQIPTEQHAQVQSLFDAHMARIAEYCDHEFIEKPSLTTVFIRWLHKIISPDGQQKMRRHEKWHLVVYCIPGNYKTLPNSIPGTDITFTEPHLVKSEMETLVRTYNSEIITCNSDEEKRNRVLKFVIDFLAIHPFGDENGRVACILADLMLVKLQVRPIYFYRTTEAAIKELSNKCTLAHRDRSISFLLDFIREYRADALES